MALTAGLAGCGARDGGTSGTATSDGTATDDATDAPAPLSPEGCVVTASAGTAEPVPTTADGSADAETTLSVHWNARTQSSMSQQDSDFVSYTPTRGNVYVVFRLELSPAVDREVRVAPFGLFGLRAHLSDATWYQEPPLQTLDAVFDTGFTLSPEASRSGVLSFEVPAELDAATLVRYADPDERPDSAFEATCDRDLDVGVGL